MVRPHLVTALLASLSLVVLVPLVALSACGSSPQPATPSLSDPSHASVDPMSSGSGALPAASVDPGDTTNDEHHPRHRKPFTIHSSCPDVATIAFGEDPKAANAGKRTVASNSSIDGPRDPEGKQTVWLLDDKGEPLVKVHISRGMKQLEIGRSCRTLDAH